MKHLGLVAAIVGSLLIAVSFLWAAIVPPETNWSYEQAKENAEAAAKYHQLQHSVGGHSHGPKRPGAKSEPPATQADLDAAKARWEESDAALRVAQGQGKQTAWWLRVGGVTMAALGVVAVIASKQRAVKVAAPHDSP